MNGNQHDTTHPHNIDELFRSAIDSYEEEPSLEVWESVDKSLDQYGIVQIKRKYDNLKKIAIALVLLLSSALLYEIGTRHLVPSTKAQPRDLALHSTQKNTTAERVVRNKETAVENEKFEPLAYGANVDQPANTSNHEPATTNVPKDYFHWQPEPAGSTNIENEELEHMASGDRTLSSLQTIQQFQQAIAVKGAPLLENSTVQSIANTSAALSAISLTAGRKRSPFSLSLVFSPDFTSRRVKEDWPINREDNKDEIRKSERYAFSYSFGALVDYRINKNWFLQSGFTLSRAVINIGPKFIFARPDMMGDMKYKFNSSSGYSFLTTKTVSRPAFGDSLHAFGTTSSLQYVSVPLSVKYKVAKKKFNLYASAGAEANILVKDKIETSLGGTHESTVNRDIRGLKPVYYSALLAAGVEYNITKTLAASFTPTARFALTSINKDAPVKSYQQSLGLVAGVTINF